MCYDQKSSFNAWVVGFVSAILLFIRNKPNDRWISLLIFVFTGMQFIEYKIWKSIDEKNKNSNKLWTKVALINVWLQTFTLSIGAMVWGEVTFNNKLLFKVLVVNLVLIVLFSLNAIKRVFDRSKTFKSIVGPNGHLIWTQDYDTKNQSKFNFISKQYPIIAQFAYMVGIMLPYLFMSQTCRALALASTIGATFAYSYANFHTTGEFTSWWCYYAVVYAFVAWLPLN